MVSPEHVDEQKSENEHILFPAEMKQPKLASSRRWISILMYIVGVVFPLVGGLLFGWFAAFGVPINVDPNAFYRGAPAAFLVGSLDCPCCGHNRAVREYALGDDPHKEMMHHGNSSRKRHLA